MNRLSDIPLFLKLLDSGSISAAARSLDISLAVASNLGDALSQAALSGLGISLHSTWHIQDDLNAGRMQVVLPK